jgi:SAM-dependent methyltransferase
MIRSMDAVCWCGGNTYEEVLHGTWNRGGATAMPFAVARCLSCGLARTDPVPDESRYARGASLWAEGKLADVWSDRLAQELLERSPGRRILDVGCNAGNLVAAAASLGAEAEGIDLDPIAIGHGREHGRNVHVRAITDQQGEWDAVALNHVLEHVTGLSGFLAEIDRLTAPDGIVMINVPCHRGTVPRIMGDHWFAWAPDEHVWQFTPATLRRVVESCTSLRATAVRQRGAIEPPSSGIKGMVKRIVAQAASAVNQGDQVEALFTKPA